MPVPALIDTRIQHGLVLPACARTPQTLGVLDRARARRPGSADAVYGRDAGLHPGNCPDEAVQDDDPAPELVISFVATIIDLAGAYRDQTRLDAALALMLTQDGVRLARIRATPGGIRAVRPPFANDCFRRHLECAYPAARKRQQRGKPPAAFAVPRLA